MTTTANLSVTKIDVNVFQKEVIANEAFDVFDAALSLLPVTMTDANYTLLTSTTPQEWQFGIIELTGTLTATRNVIATTNMKEYTVRNATTGGHDIVFKTASGSGVTIANGVTAKVFCDGTDIRAVTPGSGFSSGTVTSVNITAPVAGITASGGPITASGSITLALADDLAALEALSGTGILQRTGADTYALRTLDTDGTLAANSDTVIATQKAVKTYTDSLIAANDAMVFKGSTDCSANPNYPAADRGHTYRVSVAGKIGGASGVPVEAGDMFVCLTDGTSSGAQGAVGSSWSVIQTNIDGAVVGPASATDGHVALFDGASGKLIKDSGLTLAGTNTGDETTATIGALINGASSKSTPVDADYVGLMDSAASNVLKKLSWANIKATLKTYFDTLYAPLSQPFDMSSFYPGIPTASAVVLRVPIARAVTFAANFAGSYFSASANATGSTVFDVKNGGTTIGTITIGAGGTTATFATTGGTSKAFAAGEVLIITAPASPDATLADPGFVLSGTR